MNLTPIVEDIFKREGDLYAEPPRIDQPTGRGGITLPVLQAFMRAKTGVSTLIAIVDDLRNLTHDQAREVVQWNLEQVAATMGLEKLNYHPLKLQLLDFGYNSGEARAIRWLQRVLHTAVTGKMDANTLAVLGQCSPWLVHHALIAARLQMIDRWGDAPEHKKYEEGLENRALSFSQLTV